MTDTQGDRPEESVPSTGAPGDGAPASTPAEQAASPARPVPPLPASPAASWSAPGAGAAASPAGYTPQARHPYAGQPYGAHPAPAHPAYAAHPQQAQPVGQAFGLPTGAQPTLPLPESAETPSRKKSTAGRFVGLIVAAALVGGAAGLGGAYAGNALWGGSEATTPAAGPSTITVNDTDDVNQTTAIAAKVVPSVVTISASSGSSGGTGSGVIISDDGYVVTNTHVVTLDGQTGDATVSATTSDGRVWDAEIIGTDPTYDLAVIKLVDASGLTPIEFADSGDLNVGDETVAVGAPLGLSNTVTTGIVSALNRSIAVASAAAPDDGAPDEDVQGSQEGPFYFDFGQGQQGQATESINISVIQTDAAINPGNSGGALVDDEGRLIGINVAIASAGGSSGGQAGSIGVGFAIPSAIAQRVADEIIDTGEATHGLLGASVQAATSASDAGIAGAYIAQVVPGGAAETAGLQEGDIVTEFAGNPITNSIDLTAQVRALAAGAETSLTYVRDGESRTVDVTLGALQV